MTTLFDTAGECRHLSDRELIYNITNSRQTADNCAELSLDILSDLTPGRKMVAEAAIELYKRTMEREREILKITSSRDIYQLMGGVLSDLQYEECWILLLNNGRRVIKRIRLSVGGIDGTYIDVRLLLKQAILNNATGVIALHNHPGGEVTPSSQDRNITSKIGAALNTMNITFLDHVIIGKNRYYSFADEGML